MFTPEEQAAILAEAARAPSAHNTQPARFRFAGDEVHLLEDPDRRLAVADPEGHDQQTALGAAWEGLAMACARRGVELEERAAPEGVVARAALVEARDLEENPFAAAVNARVTWRGDFAPGQPEDLSRLRPLLAACGHGVETRVVDHPTRVAAVAHRADDASLRFMRQPAYYREFYAWLRLSPTHPDWDRDGMNAEALAIPRSQRALARFALKPGVLRALRVFGADRAVLSEADQVRGARCLVVLTRPARDPDWFDLGRGFYRAWLAVTAAGMHLCPMSALADDDETERAIRGLLELGDEVRVLNVFRAGVPTGDPPAPSPRLPVSELRVPE